MTSTTGPEESEVSGPTGHSFFEYLENRPCDDCTAPCCRLVLLPLPAPTTFHEVDHIRYLLGFPSLQIAVSRGGDWSICIVESCSLFDAQNHRCSVHGTSRQPQVCSSYDEFRCAYKVDFSDAQEGAVVRLDSRAWEVVLPSIFFDGAGQITHAPSWEELRSVVREVAPRTAKTAPAPGNDPQPVPVAAAPTLRISRSKRGPGTSEVLPS